MHKRVLHLAGALIDLSPRQADIMISSGMADEPIVFEKQYTTTSPDSVQVDADVVLEEPPDEYPNEEITGTSY